MSRSRSRRNSEKDWEEESAQKKTFIIFFFLEVKLSRYRSLDSFFLYYFLLGMMMILRRIDF